MPLQQGRGRPSHPITFSETQIRWGHGPSSSHTISSETGMLLSLRREKKTHKNMKGTQPQGLQERSEAAGDFSCLLGRGDL